MSTWDDNKPNDYEHALVVNEQLRARNAELLVALQFLVADILDYERINNLAPNPGRKYCWDSTARAIAAITKVEPGP